jgi:large subunit ribosomal protein L6
MSNIGKIKIYIPSSVTITKFNFDLDFYTLKFVGPLGSISINLPNNINIVIDLPNNTISLYSENNVMWGTIRNIIQQALTGVSTGFTKKLEVIGIGYKVSFANNVLTFNLGKSHPVVIPVIDKVKINFINSTTITASSISNSILSSFLHSICQIKPASKDHYKGKGIKISSNF